MPSYNYAVVQKQKHLSYKSGCGTPVASFYKHYLGSSLSANFYLIFSYCICRMLITLNGNPLMKLAYYRYNN